MAITYEDVNPSLIENTTMRKRYLDGVLKQYMITPAENYVLHDKLLDEAVLDPDTLEPTGEYILRYYSGTRTVAASYDFAANPREFYAVLRSSVPEDNICGVTNPPVTE